VRAVEIRRTSLSSDVVLIVEYLFAEDRGAVKAESSSANTIACSIDRFGESVCRQQLETVAQSLVDGCLQRVIVGVSTALDTERKRSNPEKRDSFDRIGGRVGVNPFTGLAGLARRD